MSYTTIISCHDLAQHYHDRQWIILDCQHNLADFNWGKQAYLKAHIPNAYFVPVEEVISGPKHNAEGQFRGRHPLPDPEVFIQAMRKFGINDSTQIVIYDGQKNMFASRLWWMLKWVGHQHVAVLDGGLPYWISQGLPTTDEIPVPEEGYLERHIAQVDTVPLSTVKDNLTSHAYQLIDARAPNRFQGENETVDPVAGHIPGALNRFFEDNLTADGLYKSAQALKEEWSALIKHPKSAIMQCGSGSSACQNLLALEIAGMHGAKLYAGSWSEWCSYSELPVATGDK